MFIDSLDFGGDRKVKEGHRKVDDSPEEIDFREVRETSRGKEEAIEIKGKEEQTMVYLPSSEVN